MDFYNDLVTQKSWLALKKLKTELSFILIGGWAVYLYTKSLKSKDIDIIVNYDQIEKLKVNYQLTKNNRLKKYEARHEEIQIDVYLPHFSELGIPVNQIQQNTQTKEAFSLPTPEILLALKLFAFKERGLSAKGQKDKVDIISLLLLPNIDQKKFRNLLQQFSLKTALENLLLQTYQVPELNISQHTWSRKKREILKNL